MYMERVQQDSREEMLTFDYEALLPVATVLVVVACSVEIHATLIIQTVRLSPSKNAYVSK